jgi:hypothetical protein
MKTNYNFSNLWAAMFFVAFSACDDNDQPVAPQIDYFSPIEGTQGTVVVLDGSFDEKATYKVFFNETEGLVSLVKNNTFTAIVPAGASTGRIKITTKEMAAESVDDFLVNESPLPVITSFFPTEGRTGDIITITGTDFSSEASFISVFFNGALATVLEAFETKLVVRVPETASTGKITITVFGQAGSSSDNFKFIAPPPQIIDVLLNVADLSNATPSISLLGPSGALIGVDEEATVVISGLNFDPNLPGNIIKINNLPIPVYESTSPLLALPPFVSARNFNRVLIGKIPKGASSGTLQVTANGVSADGPFIKINDPTVVASDPPTWKNRTVYPTFANDDGRVDVNGSFLDKGASNITHFVIGDEAFFFGSTAELLAYNVVTNTWKEKSPPPPLTTYDQSTACFVISSKAYALGTVLGNDTSSPLWEYDPAAGVGGSWRVIRDIPYSVQTTGFAIGNKGYLGGGERNSLIDFSIIKQSVFYEFSPPDVANPSGTIRAIANIGATPSNPAGVGISDALSFVVGGHGYVYTDKHFYKFTPPLNATDKGTWTPLSLPASLSNATESAGFVKDGLIYIGTGRLPTQAFQVRYKSVNTFGALVNTVANYAVFNKMAVYNPANNTWQNAKSFGNGEVGLAGGTGFSVGNRAFMGMGYFASLSTGFPTNTIYEFIK